MIDFVHCNVQKSNLHKNQGTIAIEKPLKQDLDNMLILYASHTLINIGVVKLSPKDHFNKKLGRQFATQYMQYTKCALKSVTIDGIKKIYQFECTLQNRKHDKKRNLNVCFGFSTCAENTQVRTVYGYIN